MASPIYIIYCVYFSDENHISFRSSWSHTLSIAHSRSSRGSLLAAHLVEIPNRYPDNKEIRELFQPSSMILSNKRRRRRWMHHSIKDKVSGYNKYSRFERRISLFYRLRHFRVSEVRYNHKGECKEFEIHTQSLFKFCRAQRDDLWLWESDKFVCALKGDPLDLNIGGVMFQQCSFS